MSSAAPCATDGTGAAGDRDGVGGSWESVVRGKVGEVCRERAVDLAGDVALEAADDLGLGLALGGAALCVCSGALAVAQAADGDHVQRAVGVAVAAVVEAVTVGASGGCRDWAGAGERSERAVAAQ